MSKNGLSGRPHATSILIAELRGLRKHRQPLSASSLYHAKLLVRGLGGGDAEVALERLISLADEHGEDRDITAAMVSIGWDSNSTNVLERLNEFGSLHNVDQRTARRWSDIGIEKLAVLLVGATPWMQPHIALVLSLAGSIARFRIEVRVPPNMLMGRPSFRIDGRNVAVSMPVVELSSHEQHYRSQLEDTIAVEDFPATLDLEWHGEKPAAYTAVLEGSEGIRLQATIRLGYLRCRLSVCDGRERLE